MQFKVIEFKQATCSNRDYQLNDAELKFEMASKERKWNALKKEREDVLELALAG